MRVAAAVYPLDALATPEALVRKYADWVTEAAGAGADLLVFPEYAMMELAALAGAETAADIHAAAEAASDALPNVDGMFAEMADAHGIWICAGTGPCRVEDGRFVNRARLFGPRYARGTQDKLVPTPYERDPWCISAGTGLTVFETPQARIGIATCYDAEFPGPPRAMAEAGAEIILVPSATETLAGYNRVRVGAMARALENQVYTVQAPLVGAASWCPAVDMNRGAAAVYAPPDTGMPDTGVLAEGALDTPGWVYADLDLEALRRLRHSGSVRGFAHWPEAQGHGPARVETLG